MTHFGKCCMCEITRQNVKKPFRRTLFPTERISHLWLLFLHLSFSAPLFLHPSSFFYHSCLGTLFGHGGILLHIGWGDGHLNEDLLSNVCTIDVEKLNKPSTGCFFSKRRFSSCSFLKSCKETRPDFPPESIFGP